MTLFNFVPSGTVLSYSGTDVPAGWLLCDGSAVSRAIYANLYSAIGIAWGSGDGVTTFHLPDLRGRFLRGVDGTAGRDPDRTTRLAANPGGNTGNNIGSVQGNATAKNGLSATAASSSISALALNANTTTVSGNRNQFDRASGTVSADHAHYTTTGGISANHYHGTGGAGWHDHGRWTGAYSSSFYGSAIQRIVEGNGGLTLYSYSNGSHSHNTGWVSSDHVHGGWSGGINTNHTHTTTWDSTFSASGTTPAQTLSSGTASAQSITVGTGDNETRPSNINVNFFIKI